MSVDPRNAKILLVERNNTVARIVKDLLLQYGLTDCTHLPYGPEALSALEKTDYTLVITEWAAEIDGRRFVEVAHKEKSLPCIAVLQNEEGDQLEAARAAGARACIVKPLDHKALHKAVFETLGLPI